MPSPTEIAVSQFARLVGTPDAPAVVNLRTDGDFAADPHPVPGAFRRPHAAPGTFAPKRAGRRSTAGCRPGREVGRGDLVQLDAGTVPRDAPHRRARDAAGEEPGRPSAAARAS